MKRAIVSIVLVGVFLIVFVFSLGFFFLNQCEDDWCFLFQWQKVRAATSFERCVLLGFPVMESYPRQCRAGEKSFTEVIQPIENENVRVTTPSPNAVVKSPLFVSGEARGTWYFEASFPVRLLDGNGKEIAIRPAQAKSEWMTIDFVPFEVLLEFIAPETPVGTLEFVKDNPSGLPEHDDSFSIPVRFTQ
jgi:hypothetical protein